MVHWPLLLLAALPVWGQEPLNPDNMLPGCPDIVPRSEWGALPSSCLKPLNLPVEYVVVSHTAGQPCNSASSCEQQMRNIQFYHINTLGWCDIAYNFLIGEDGLIYEGRGWSTLGAHTGPAWNPISLGISFIGNFMERAPSPRALRAAQSLISCGLQHQAIARQYMIKGHRDVQNTASPGDKLYAKLRTWPHYRE
ncbi:peptidoglycan recognition protein 1 [Monodelphis domestica]|uniref:peptidoglycan recognition protein 1 n=1 Tax=Monodelphis domestica TaxID=13616 RepID=UPI0024E26B93|nr:peptidoglycan recognition protein 1 [Monodelphis domestica]